MRSDLFIGITTWNSARFLPHCLDSIARTVGGAKASVAVIDNCSSDESAQLAREWGAEVHVRRCSQQIALNMLLDLSRARHSLLIHSDVVLLDRDWYVACSRQMAAHVALVSPEDIGCGPLTRPYGRGKPESCFMLFDTKKARRCRTWSFVRRRGVPWPTRSLHLEQQYVTHDLPETLGRRGYTWHPMTVHASPREDKPLYTPPFTPEYWDASLGHLRYAMGNFYSVEGVITHYHNWYDRVPKDVPADSRETTEGAGRGLPLAFLSAGTRRFMEDLAAGALRLPDIRAPQPEPRVTTRHAPDLGRPFGT